MAELWHDKIAHKAQLPDQMDVANSGRNQHKSSMHRYGKLSSITEAFLY